MRWDVAVRCLPVLLGIAVLLSLPGSALAGAGHGEWEKVVDGYHVELVIAETVNPGKTPVEVKLSQDGMPVAKAKVRIAAVLKGELPDAHGEAEADAHAEGEVEDSHLVAGDAHSETEDAHGEADGGHAEDDHADADSHVESEADAHAEGADHDHSESLLFELQPAGEPGTYAGSVILHQTGQWAVDVHFTLDGQEREVGYLLEIVPVDRGGTILAAFVGLNTIVIGVAAFLKRKSAAAR